MAFLIRFFDFEILLFGTANRRAQNRAGICSAHLLEENRFIVQVEIVDARELQPLVAADIVDYSQVGPKQKTVPQDPLGVPSVVVPTCAMTS